MNWLLRLAASLLFGSLLKQPSHRQKIVHWTPLWQHSQYFLRHLVFLHLHPLRTSSCCTPKLKTLFSGTFCSARCSWLKPWVSVWALRARASMIACWCSSLLPTWFPQFWQLQCFPQNIFFWKQSQQSFRHRERLQLQLILTSSSICLSSSYTCGIIIMLRELLESLLSENSDDESRIVCDTEKLSSNFFLKDFLKDQESSEFSFQISSLTSPPEEFQRELSCLIEEGIRRSFELELLRIFRKSERLLSVFDDLE